MEMLWRMELLLSSKLEINGVNVASEKYTGGKCEWGSVKQSVSPFRAQVEMKQSVWGLFMSLTQQSWKLHFTPTSSSPGNYFKQPFIKPC